ncbi:MAG: glycosyltransferase [Acidimicrobiales bacterium]|nr:glycosyltransferase [Acidimicrobiales bacterium]
MFPFWEKVVAPLLDAAGVRRLVEIGALRGENTQLILDRLGPGTELHVIDPVPDFDVDEHRARFGPGYVFHRALSVDVLDGLPPMDGALVDGDHNWYTVYNELRLLREVAEAAGRPMPVTVLHDVGWPYGRRDLYYAPDTVPEEHRQPWQRRGMRPGVERVVPVGGLNPTMCNAVVEGGPRNGVMTAVDDFVTEFPRPLRTMVLPIYFGLAILVEEEWVSRRPEVGAFLDWLDSNDGKDMLLELSESIRIDAMLFQHQIYFNGQAATEALATKYLDSTKRALTNEHYLEVEVRLAHLADCVERERPPQIPSLRDPIRHDAVAYRNLRTVRRTGQVPEGEDVPPMGYAYGTRGRASLDALTDLLDGLRDDHVRGDLATCGVGRGGTAILLRAYLDAHGVDGRQVWVADRFRAAPEGQLESRTEDGLAALRGDLNQVREGFDHFGLLDDTTRFLQGDLAATLPDAPIESLALLHVGPGLGAAARDALDHLYPRLAVGGAVVVDPGEDDPAAREAVAAFRRDAGLDGPTDPFGATGLTWRKTDDAVRRPTPRPAEVGAARAPLAVPAATGTCDLSVVVCFYDMRREAARTLRSLSRAYQEGIEDLDYEVIVVENGTAPDRRLGEELVRGFGPEFRYLDLGEEATPSPADALNRGISASRGDALALMIDGAHVLTPGVLRHARTGLAAYAPAVVAVQPWYVGPGQQGDAMRNGYDRDEEDRLFTSIGWPNDGYRLFEIAHFQGDRDWLDGLWESNCLFVTRKLLEQVGGFDEGFHSAGGGYTNLDIYERLGASPGVNLVSVLGEGSFHQVHGGTTTNLSDPEERRATVFSYGERYAELRGRPYTGPEKRIFYVGGFHGEPARRTRARRMTGAAFEVDPALEGEEGPLGRPVPIPDDLRDAFVAAYHRGAGWRSTSWLGTQALNAPTDLITYQEIVDEVRPDWIIETGTRTGGRAMFLASVCDALGHGRIVSIDNRADTERPEHPRVTYVEGRAQDDDVVARVREIVGPDPHALVILGTRGARRRMHREFETYRRFVPVGSYVIMEHTVLNGYPVQASYGPGPFEAVRRLLASRGEFVVDTSREKHGLSFNLGGYLRRIR